MSGGTEIPVEGVNPLDHTADLALEITAPDAPALFRRSARGMMHLLLDRIPESEEEGRELEVEAVDLPGLLRKWLRELLYWHDAEGFSVASCEIEELDDGTGSGTGPGEGLARIRATVRGGFDEGPPVREIKGVTLHGLAAEPRNGGWYGRVVFDV